MTHAIPVPLPSALIDHHAIDLERRYSDGWGVKVEDVATAPSGDFYVLYEVNRHAPACPADAAPGPATATCSYALITRYAADGTPLATAVSGQHESLPQDVAFGGPATGLGRHLWSVTGLCVLPDGTLAATGSGDHTDLISADLTTVTAHYSMPGSRHEDGPRDPFAQWISTTPAGRLLCTTGEYGLSNYANLLSNIVSIADGPLTAASKPTLRALTSMEAAPVKHTEADLRPGVLLDGEPVGMGHRPRPSLTEHLALEQGVSQWEWHGAQLGRPAAVREDLFVVPVFGRTYRGGSRGQRFAFLMVSDQGEIVGQLGGMHLHRDSPFTGFCFEIAGDPVRERVYHLNRYGLYAWTATGVRAQRLDLEDKRYKPLRHFTLMDCTPDGELILVHRTQHLLLRIPCPASLGDLGPAVEDALRCYTRERAALKKRWRPVNWHWADNATPVHRL